MMYAALFVVGWMASGYIAALLCMWDFRRDGLTPPRGLAAFIWLIGYVGLLVAAAVMIPTTAARWQPSERLDAFLRKVLP